MRKIGLFLAGMVLFALPGLTQKNIQLRNGVIKPVENITEAFINSYNSTAQKIDGSSWVLLQFKSNPAIAERTALKNAGVELLQYIPHNIFVAVVTSPLNAKLLRNNNAVSVMEVQPEHKIAAALLPNLNSSSGIEVMVSLFEKTPYESAEIMLNQQGFAITNAQFKKYDVIQVSVPAGKLWQLASFPFIQSIEALPPPPEDLNFNSRNSAKANILSSRVPGGYNLTGEGVTIGVGEVNGLHDHADFKDRLIGQPFYISNLNTYHSTHVHGIVGGAGLVYEPLAGYAPKSKLLTLTTSSTISVSGTPASQGMVISNNSYGAAQFCQRDLYSLAAFLADRDAVTNDHVVHVFGAGNSGNTACMAYPPGFSTMGNIYQISKSTITVGNILPTGELAASSSKGPAPDGRIKPELVTIGTNVLSTVAVNAYGYNSGTSMSSPAVAGGLGLLYQRYRQLHNGQNPKNSLMKAIICNTATDMGNKGPDFSFGFGSMNLLRAINTLDKESYFYDSVANQSTKTHSITVPAGTSQLKVMLYWQDPATSALSPKVLVNDLDLEVSTPSSGIVLPYVLDTLPSLVNNPAKRGEDHLNNIEQVVVDNPVPGTYSIRVKGTEVGYLPPQRYSLVYDIVPDDAVLTFPFGGESLVPGENVNIQWDSWGHSTSTFHLQYSADDGATWQTINASVPADKRQFSWTVPSMVTNKARVRLTRNEDARTTTSNTFIIIGQPLLALSLAQCPEHITIEWSPVTGATDYEVMMVRNGEMASVNIVTGVNNYIFRNLSIDSVYWVTVRPRLNGVPGRRAVAVSRKPDSGACAGSISDHDLKPATIEAPVFGRQFTSKMLTSNETVSVRIKNMDDAPVTGFSVHYSVDNDPWVHENSTLTIPALGEISVSFSVPYDFSAIKNYTLKVVAKNAGDINELNDTLTYVVRHVPNPVLDLATIPTDGFEQLASRTYTKTAWAFIGAERIDYEKESGSGYFSSNDIASTGANQHNITLYPPGNGNQHITGTYNLLAYDTALHRIGLDFVYTKFSENGPANDTLFIRGNDAQPWIAVFPLDPGFAQYVTNKLVGPIIVTDYLKATHQNFSSSFQVRFSQQTSGTGYTLDDIRLFNLTNDAGIVSIDSLRPRNCAGGNATPIRITIENRSRHAMIDVPVRYRINNGPVITEAVTLPAASTTRYTFTAKADLSSFSDATIDVWTELAGDTYNLNDRKTIVTRNHPMITTLPYLENFENGNGNWYSEGTNSSWQYGTPSATFINGAASGNKAWKTNLNGTYNNSETSYLYSPCFDISALNKPMISISIAINTDSCTICDLAIMSYSTNGGVDWRSVFGPQSSGYNWPNVFRSRYYTRWHVASSRLSDTIGQVQFRLLFRSDAGINGDGIAVDDIHIYDSTAAVYDNNSNSNVISKMANGNEWIDFKDNDRLIASIHPRGQDLGTTTVQSFSHSGAPNFQGQYYLKRNFNIKSANTINDSVIVRLYVPDRETDSVLFAYNCPTCTKPANAYQFGISQYNSSRMAELNGLLPDNVKGDWKFIPPVAVKTVPFQKGYYLEFKTKSLSEFWLNNGGINKNSYLPVKFNTFSATRGAGNTGDIHWETASEINIQRFEIEVAKGNDAYLQDSYTKVGEVSSGGASVSAQTYQYTDAEPNKEGVYYYRIKALDVYGNYSYSKAAPIVYNNEYVWNIAPNLSGGLFNLVYQVNAGDEVSLEIFNSVGSLIKTEQFKGNGFIDQHAIDLRNTKYAGGLYFVKVKSGSYKGVFRIIKQ
jgi:hypothetical protein